MAKLRCCLQPSAASAAFTRAGVNGTRRSRAPVVDGRIDPGLDLEHRKAVGLFRFGLGEIAFEVAAADE
jgi:hypothetical protein